MADLENRGKFFKVKPGYRKLINFFWKTNGGQSFN